MRKKKRDFAAEYRRRIQRGLAKGLSKSQARGHRRPSEAKVTKNAKQEALEDHRLQLGLRFLRKERSFAKQPERLGYRRKGCAPMLSNMESSKRRAAVGSSSKACLGAF